MFQSKEQGVRSKEQGISFFLKKVWIQSAVSLYFRWFFFLCRCFPFWHLYWEHFGRSFPDFLKTCCCLLLLQAVFCYLPGQLSGSLLKFKQGNPAVYFQSLQSPPVGWYLCSCHTVLCCGAAEKKKMKWKSIMELPEYGQSIFLCWRLGCWAAFAEDVSHFMERERNFELWAVAEVWKAQRVDTAFIYQLFLKQADCSFQALDLKRTLTDINGHLRTNQHNFP